MVDEEVLILLNQCAQGVRQLEDGINWFRGLLSDEQREVLRTLSYLTLQAGAGHVDVNNAIRKSELKPTFTPCVLLQKEADLGVQLAKVVSLPPDEHEKSFRLLLCLLSVADERRRDTKCSDGCAHWWHKDLSDEETVNRIRKYLKSGERVAY